MEAKAKKCDYCGTLMNAEEFRQVPVIYQDQKVEVDLCPNCSYVTSRCCVCELEIIDYLEPETLESLGLSSVIPYVITQDEEPICLKCLLKEVLGKS